jgi:peptide/nickel transport system permease protein
MAERESVSLGTAAVATQAHDGGNRRGLWAGVLRQRLAVIGLVIVGFFAIVAIVGPLVAPSGPTEQFSADRLRGPSADCWFGKDEFGHDIFSRLLYGARISFQVGVTAVGISAVIGVLIRLVAGYLGGWIDNIASLLMDVLYAFPTILLAIAIMAMLGNSLANVMIAIGIVNAPTFMRVIRGRCCRCGGRRSLRRRSRSATRRRG